MKIGILTLRLHNNYGGNLQAYSLMEFLKRQGHDPYLIRRKSFRKDPSVKDSLKEIITKTMLRFPKAFKSFIKKKKLEDLNVISVNSEYFINKYIQPHTLVIDRPHLFEELEDYHFDAYIVGSDQVWRKDYLLNGFLDSYFLNFPKDKSVKKISYAASFGFDKWDFNEVETERLKKYIQEFDLVTVREDSGVELCEKYLGIDSAKHVIDPTMLLTKEDYTELAQKENAQKPEGDCMVYVLDMNQEKKELIEQIAKDKGLKTYTVNQIGFDKSVNQNERIYPAATDWIKGFMDAEFVITDSFHGTVFSLIFNKPFLVIGNHGRGFTRFSSLGKLFNIENRILSSAKEFTPKVLWEQIDWDFINRKMEQERKYSEELLGKALNNQTID